MAASDCGCGNPNANGGPLLSGTLGEQYAGTSDAGGSGSSTSSSPSNVSEASLIGGTGKLWVACALFWIFVAGVEWDAYSGFEKRTAGVAVGYTIARV